MFPDDPTHTEVVEQIQAAKWPVFQRDARRFIDEELDNIIAATPTGPRRERLTDAAMMLGRAIEDKDDVRSLDVDIEGEAWEDDGNELTQ